jgi:hypothetical protein
MASSARRAVVVTVVSAALLAAAPSAFGARVAAAFGARSYRPGEVAALHVVSSPSRSLHLTVFAAAALRDRDVAAADLSPSRPVTLLGPAPWTVWVPVGRWPSGVYVARLVTTGGSVGYAPLIVRPLFLGTSRTLVVEPTNTWQAYNPYGGDSWYFDGAVTNVDLNRPYAGSGLPPHFDAYDLGFLRWLAATHASADVVSDDDLARFVDGQQLRRLYDLIVFPGHEEYVTGHVFGLATDFRNRGGNLAFLSANSFFYEVTRPTRSLMVGRVHWDSLGRPAAPLVGGAYVGWDERIFPNRPYVVVGARRLPWLFAGTGLSDGRSFGLYGIEIDERTGSSPPGTVVAARIAGDFGGGSSAEMTYYRDGHAQVFDAGVLNFGGSVSAWHAADVMLRNLWVRFDGRFAAAS